VLFLPAVAAAHSVLGGVAYYATGYVAGGVAAWGLLATALAGIGLPGPEIVLVITSAGLGATLLLLVYPASRSSDPATAFALAIVALLFWTRLYSPQFSLWLVPFFALTPLRRRTFVLLSAADVAVFLTASPLTLVRWESPDGLPSLLLGVLAAAVALRHVALILAWRELRASR